MRKRVVKILILLFLFGMIGDNLPNWKVKLTEKVYATEYNYPIEETKKTLELDENCKDAQGIFYTLDEENKTAMVGKNNGSMNNTSGYVGANNQICIIPEKVNMNGTEYTVTKISADAFAKNLNLTTLVVADTVEEVGQYAFLHSKLEYLYIGSGVKYISEWAFHNSEYLREIKVSENNIFFMDLDGVLYSANMEILYYNPPLIKDSQMAVYKIPEGVKRIVSYAFSFCKYRRVELSSTVQTIGEFGFDQSYIQEIDLSNVTKIGDDTFRGCGFLRYIKMPISSYSVGNDSFGSLGSLEGLLLTKGLKIDGTGSVPAFEESLYLKCLAIEEGTTEIPSEYFRGCKSLKTVIIPDSVTIIKSNAFSNCESLSKIYIPSSVTLISNGAFSGNNTTIYGEAGSKAESFAKENGFTFVDVNSVQHENSAELIIFENDFMKIVADYCKECGKGTNVKVIKKESDVIYDATHGDYPFDMNKTKEIKVLNNGEDDQGLTYSGYTYGTTYSCNNGAFVKAINDGTGKDHIVLPEVIVSNGEKYILSDLSKTAFKNSERVESLVISDTVTDIDAGALETSSLKYLYIGANVKNISEYAFGTYQNIKGIWVSSANLNYYVKNYVLYDKTGNVIYDFSANADETTEENTTEENTTEVTTTESETTEKETTVTTEVEITEATTEKTTEVETTEATTEKTTEVETTEATTEKTTEVENTEATTEKPTDIVLKKPSKVSGMSLSTDNGNRIVVKWNKSQNCTHYEVYRSVKSNKGYKCIKTISAKQTSYKDSKIKLYKKYYYKVRAVNKQKNIQKAGSYSKVANYTVNGLRKPKLSVKKKKSAGIHYLLLNVSNTSGKYIELSVKKENGKYKKVKLKSNQLSKKKTVLKIGYMPGKQRMWLRVRTYKKVKKKTYYSEYSNPVLIKK